MRKSKRKPGGTVEFRVPLGGGLEKIFIVPALHDKKKRTLAFQLPEELKGKQNPACDTIMIETGQDGAVIISPSDPHQFFMNFDELAEQWRREALAEITEHGHA